MEEAIKLLTNYGVPADKARQVAYDVAQAMTDMWKLEDIECVAEDMEIELTDAQKREALAYWRSMDCYGELDREGIEWAIKQILEEAQ